MLLNEASTVNIFHSMIQWAKYYSQGMLPIRLLPV